MENVEQPLMTLEELCEALMIGKNAAYRLLKEGKIKAFRSLAGDFDPIEID